MKLLTREEKKDKELMGLYNRYIKEGMKPQRAVREAKQNVNRKNISNNG